MKIEWLARLCSLALLHIYKEKQVPNSYKEAIMKSNADRNSLPLARLMARSDYIN